MDDIRGAEREETARRRRAHDQAGHKRRQGAI